MTVCKCLKTAQLGPDVVTVYEMRDKYDAAPYYQIIISRDGIGYLTEKTARTTWKKRFEAIVGGYNPT